MFNRHVKLLKVTFSLKKESAKEQKRERKYIATITSEQTKRQQQQRIDIFKLWYWNKLIGIILLLMISVYYML